MDINVYINLLKDFLCNKITADDFERRFLGMFKSETNCYSKLFKLGSYIDGEMKSIIVEKL